MTKVYYSFFRFAVLAVLLMRFAYSSGEFPPKLLEEPWSGAMRMCLSTTSDEDPYAGYWIRNPRSNIYYVSSTDTIDNNFEAGRVLKEVYESQGKPWNTSQHPQYRCLNHLSFLENGMIAGVLHDSHFFLTCGGKVFIGNSFLQGQQIYGRLLNINDLFVLDGKNQTIEMFTAELEKICPVKVTYLKTPSGFDELYIRR